MAPYSYYYFTSIAFLVGAILWIATLMRIRTAGRTLFGQNYKRGTREYARVVRLASNRNVSIALVLVVILAANLVNSAYRVVHLGSSDARFLLIFAPVVTILAYGFGIYYMRQQFDNSTQNRRD
jgi:hypothetical protein